MASTASSTSLGPATTRQAQPAPRTFHPSTLALVASFTIDNDDRYFWSDWTKKRKMLKVQDARKNEEVLSQEEGEAAMAQLEQLVPDPVVREDILAALSWGFDAALCNLEYQTEIRNCKWSAIFLAQHNERDTMFQHYVGCLPTLGMLLWRVLLYQWASGGYKTVFPDPEPFLPIIRPEDNAPGVYTKTGTTSTAYGPCAVHNPFDTRAELDMPPDEFILDPMSDAAQKLVFERTKDGEEPLSRGFMLRYQGQSVAQDGMGGRTTGPGHGKPSYKKQVDGSIRHGTSSIAYNGRPADREILDDDIATPSPRSVSPSPSPPPDAPTQTTNKLSRTSSTLADLPTSRELLSPSLNRQFFAAAAINRSHSDGLFSLVEQTLIEETASWCSQARLEEASSEGMPFVSAGAGFGIGTNMVSAFDRGMSFSASTPLENLKQLFLEGLPLAHTTRVDWTDTGSTQRYAFPTVWGSGPPDGISSFSFSTKLLSSLGMSKRNRPRVVAVRDTKGWTAILKYFKPDDIKREDAEPVAWAAPLFSPAVMIDHMRYYVSIAITRAAAFQREHPVAVKKAGACLADLCVTKEDVHAAQIIVDKGPMDGGARGKRKFEDEKAAVKSALRLQYGTFTKSVVIKKGPLSLKGMVVAPPITFSLDPSAFSKTATLKSVPQDYTAPFARRNAADDWTLGFDDSTFTVPLDAAVLHLKPRKLQQLHQALEMHWSAGKKERGA